MNFDEIEIFIRDQNKLLAKMFPVGDDQSRVFRQFMKMSEEVGELADAILKKNNLQRSDKYNDSDDNEIAYELADVLITVMLLADTLDIDVKKALTDKIAKIKARY